MCKMNKYLEPIAKWLEENKNEWWSAEDEFILLQRDIVNKMEADKVSIEAIQPILELMEEYPLVEFGTPGQLTHFIESFYKENKALYEDLLEQSVKKKPAVHTIWLLNRVINASEEAKAKEYIQIMKSIYNNKTLHENIQASAKDFLEYQEEL